MTRRRIKLLWLTAQEEALKRSLTSLLYYTVTCSDVTGSLREAYPDEVDQEYIIVDNYDEALLRFWLNQVDDVLYHAITLKKEVQYA